MQTFAPRLKTPQIGTFAKPLRHVTSRQVETHWLPPEFSFSKVPIYPPETQDAHAYSDTPKSKKAPTKKTPTPPKTATPAKHGNVIASITKGPLSRPETGSVDPDDFGTTHFDPTFTEVSSPFNAGKCTITATFNTICPWGTQSRGKHDVPSGTARIITADNFPKIVTDLTPDSDPPFKSPREHYYSKALVERHERFHGKQTYDFVGASGMRIIKDHLEAGSVTATDTEKQVKALLDGAAAKVVAEDQIHLRGGGTDHDSFQGEIDAYRDGKPEYEKLAADVQKHGEDLKAHPVIPRNTRRR